MRGAVTIVGVFALWGCSAADPGVEGLTRVDLTSHPQPVADGGAHVEGGVTKEAGGGTDSSVAPDAAPSDAFTGAGAYTSALPAQTAVKIHQNKGVGVTPGKATPCLSCHGNGGNAPEFLFGGTAFKDKAGTIPAANLEVRVRGSDGTGFLAHSDLDGNFWLLKANNTLVTPALTGVRDSATTSLMSGNITDTNCNGCHNGNGTDPVHLP